MLHINIAEREKNEPLEPGEPALEPEGNKLMTEKEIPIPILNPVTTQFDEIVIEAAVATPTKQSHFIFHKRTYNLFHLIFVVAIIIFATLIAITQSQPEKEEQTTERILRIFDKSPRRALDELKELNITALDFGLTLTEAKHKKALYWYKQMAEIDPENEATYLFGTAWNYFHYFQPEEAKKTLVLARGLAEKSKNKKLFAKCTQLLADIYYSQGNLELAYQHSHNALAIFRDLKLFGASSNCLFQLFDFHIKANDIEGAEKTLDQYEKENSLRKNPSDGLSRLYYGKANILMHRTKYPEAIVIFRKSHNLAHEREINYKLRISILIGLCQALKGDLKTAMQQAKSNDDFMSQYPDSNYLQYANDLIWLVIYKCSGHWDIDLEKKIAIWARENDASGVTLNTLQFVKNAPCP